MGPRLDHTASINDDDAVELGDRGQAVRDHQRSRGSHQSPQRLLYVTLRLGVERAGRLVEDQHGRALEHGLGDGYPLALAPGQLEAPFAHDCLVALGQLSDEFVHVCRRRHLAHPVDVDRAGLVRWSIWGSWGT